MRNLLIVRKLPLVLGLLVVAIPGCTPSGPAENSLVGVWRSDDGSVSRAFHEASISRTYRDNGIDTGIWRREGNKLEVWAEETQLPSGEQLDMRYVTTPVMFQVAFADNGTLSLTDVNGDKTTYIRVPAPTDKKNEIAARSELDQSTAFIAERLELTKPIVDWVVDENRISSHEGEETSSPKQQQTGYEENHQ